MRRISIGRAAVFIFILCFFIQPHIVRGQTRTLTLMDAIEIAQAQSYEAMVSRMNLMSQYWSLRSYKAQLLPSINLAGDLMEFDRSMVETRNYDTGEIRYVENNTLSNSLMLSVDQNIAALGGTISLQSYLYRLDQFSYDNTLYNSRPIRLKYTQPLFSFNRLKWLKKTEPLKYDIAKRKYLQSMESVGSAVINLFFNVLSAQSELRQAQSNLDDRKLLYEMAKKRFELGTITKSELLQLELSVLNAEVTLNKQKIAAENEMFALSSYLRLPSAADMTLLPPPSMPDIMLSQPDVISRAMENSAHSLELNLNIIQSEQEVAQAKAERGIQIELHGELGFNNSGDSFKSVYSGLRDNEIVGMSLSLPLFDWGVGKGRVKMAQADLEATKIKNDQLHDEYIQKIVSDVKSFNIHGAQCKSALRAQDIATERYDITKRHFEGGTISVTDLNTAWQEAESARSQYLQILQSYWSVYYSIRQSTLYDWVNGIDLNEIFDYSIISELK